MYYFTPSFAFNVGVAAALLWVPFQRLGDVGICVFIHGSIGSSSSTSKILTAHKHCDFTSAMPFTHIHFSDGMKK